MEALERRKKSYHGNIQDSLIREVKTKKKKVKYPDSDGQPIADNTLQFHWITKIKNNLDIMYKNDPNVFVAGALLRYAVEGNNKIRIGPDVMVAFGRPKGDRGAYKMWEEGNIAPQVVFEILSHRNMPKKMAKQFSFYDTYGVEEYYLYDPYKIVLRGWIRLGNDLTEIAYMNGWRSPRLKIQFETTDADLYIYYPDGRKFLSTVEFDNRVEAERQRAELSDQRAEEALRKAEEERLRAELAEQKAEAERQKAETERRKAEEERLRAERLTAKLRELGIEPDL